MWIWMTAALAASPFVDCDPYGEDGLCGSRQLQVLTLAPEADAAAVVAHAQQALEKSGREIASTDEARIDLAGTPATATGWAFAGGEVAVQVVAGRLAVVCQDRDASGDIALTTRWCAAAAELALAPQEEPVDCGLTVEEGRFVHEAGVSATLPPADDWQVDCKESVVHSRALDVRVAARVGPGPSGSFNETSWLLDLGSRQKELAREADLGFRAGAIEVHDGRRIYTYAVKIPGPMREQRWNAWASTERAGTVADLQVIQRTTGVSAASEQKDALIEVLQSMRFEPEDE